MEINCIGEIVFRSREVLGKVTNFSVGGYTVETKEGVIINFDWESYEANAKVNADGTTTFIAILRNFEIYNEEPLVITNTEELLQAIVTGTILEAYYECTDENEENMLLDLVSFSIDSHEFIPEQVEKFNSMCI